MINKNVRLGDNCKIQKKVFLGMPSRDFLDRDVDQWPLTKIGKNSLIRSGSVIYCDVTIGQNFQTGHNVVIREKTTIGDRVLVGTNSVIEGSTSIGNDVNIQSMAYLPINTLIEDKVFIGPNAVLTNDKYPIRTKEPLKGPIIRRSVSLGANCTILSGIEIGEGAMIAAGAIVTKNIPSYKLAIGAPAKIKDLPDKFKIDNLLGG